MVTFLKNPFDFFETVHSNKQLAGSDGQDTHRSSLNSCLDTDTSSSPCAGGCTQTTHISPSSSRVVSFHTKERAPPVPSLRHVQERRGSDTADASTTQSLHLTKQQAINDHNTTTPPSRPRRGPAPTPPSPATRQCQQREIRTQHLSNLQANGSIVVCTCQF